MPMVSDDLQMRVQSCKFQIRLNVVWVQATPTSYILNQCLHQHAVVSILCFLTISHDMWTLKSMSNYKFVSAVNFTRTLKPYSRLATLQVKHGFLCVRESLL